MKIIFSILIIAGLMNVSFAAGDRDFDSTPALAISGPILIVTHAEKRWDRLQNAKLAIDAAIRRFQEFPNSTIVFLAEADYEENPDKTYSDRRTLSWYTEMTKTSLNLLSNGGEHLLKISSSEVTLIGGNFGLCQTTTMFDVLKGYTGTGTLTIRMPIKAIFRGSGGYAKTLEEERKSVGEAGLDQSIMYELSSYQSTFTKLGFTAQVERSGKVVGHINGGEKLVKISFEE